MLIFFFKLHWICFLANYSDHGYIRGEHSGVVLTPSGGYRDSHVIVYVVIQYNALE